MNFDVYLGIQFVKKAVVYHERMEWFFLTHLILYYHVTKILTTNLNLNMIVNVVIIDTLIVRIWTKTIIYDIFNYRTL